MKSRTLKALFVMCPFIVGTMVLFPNNIGAQSGKVPSTAGELKAQLTSELRVNEVPTKLDIFVGPQGGTTKGSEDHPLMIGLNRGQFGRQGTVHFTWDVSHGAGSGVGNRLRITVTYDFPNQVIAGIRTLSAGDFGVDSKMTDAVQLSVSKDAYVEFGVWDTNISILGTLRVPLVVLAHASDVDVNFIKERLVSSGQLRPETKIVEPIKLVAIRLMGIEYSKQTYDDFMRVYCAALFDEQRKKSAEAAEKAKSAAKTASSLSNGTSGAAINSDQTPKSAQAQKSTQTGGAAQPGQKAGLSSSNQGKSTGIANTSTSSARPPASAGPSPQVKATNPRTATTYSPPPPPQSQIDYARQAAAEAQRQFQATADSVAQLDKAFDDINRRIAKEHEDWSRWSAASTLNTMQSPEGMIRDAKEKKAELDRQTREREAEFNQKVVELAKEAASKYSGDQATAGAWIAAATAVVGNISLEAQKAQAKKDIDAQQTRAFQEIQKKNLAVCDGNIEAAMSDMAMTVFPDEFHYFKALVTYYQSYKRKLVDEFTITDTDWLYPDRNPPKEPAFSKMPNLPEEALSSFLKEKWDFYSSSKTDLKATSADSIQALSQDAIHRYPDFADGYYYSGLFAQDSLERWMLFQQAKARAPQRSDIAQSWSAATTKLSNELFGAIAKGDTPKITRIWTSGVGRDFKDGSGQNPYYSALLVNPASLQALLDASTDQERQWVPQSLIVLAAADGNNRAVQLLAHSGADPLKANEAGIAPIVAAADRGHYDTIALLDTSYHSDPMDGLALAHSLKVDAAVYHLQVYNLGKAFSGDNVVLAKQLVLERGDLPLAPLSGKETFLAGCVRKGKPEMLKLFLENPDYTQFRDTAGNSLADLAMGADAPDEIFKILGAASALSPAKGPTALCYSASKGRTELASYLLAQGADPNEKGIGGQTALHLAAKGNQCEMVRLLSANQADPMICDDQGKTLFHVAAQFLDPTAIVPFVNNVTAPFPADRSGKTPLAVALQWHRPEAAKALVAMQADLTSRDMRGRTVLLQSILTCPEYALSLLADPSVFNIADNDGDTPLAAAIRLGRQDCAEKLVEGGADLNKPDKNGMTPVHWAALSTDPEIRSIISSADAGLLQKDKHGKTPFHYLLSRGQGDLAAPLVVDRKIPGDVSDEEGITLLDLAITNKLTDVAQELVGNSANLNIQQATTGYTALHVAVLANDKSMVAVLLKAGANRNLRDWKEKRAQDLAYQLHENDIGDLIKKWK